MWTDDQVKSLKARQNSWEFHPYTCVCGAGTLEVSNEGLYCTECGYTQTWAYSSDLNWGWKEMLAWDIDEDGRIILE
jgi:hypothetical protein